MEMNQRPIVVIAGANGFIGSELSERLTKDGYEVRAITRSGAFRWDQPDSLTRALEGGTWLINLAGKSVQCRPSQRNIQELIDSRVNTTRALGDAIARCSKPPRCWINASGAGIYAEDGIGQVEHSPTIGGTIMAEVARQWEAAFEACDTPSTRKVTLRITLVLGASGGVFPVFKQLVKYRQGGRQGSGNQRMSWIHIHDLYNMMLHIFAHDNIQGPVNAASPRTYSNAEFMRSMRKVMGVGFGLPAPSWLLRIGAVLLGINSELVLASMDVYPKKMIDHGFSFTYSQLEDALKECARMKN